MLVVVEKSQASLEALCWQSLTDVNTNHSEIIAEIKFDYSGATIFVVAKSQPFPMAPSGEKLPIDAALAELTIFERNEL